MSLSLSTGLRDKLNSGKITSSCVTITGTDIAAVDGGAGVDTFTSVAGGFVTAGFIVDDVIVVSGFTGANAGSIGPFALTVVVAGTLTVATGSITASDAATESITITTVLGGSIRDIFRAGVLKIYTGTQPTTADYAATGTLLVTISIGSGAWVAGTPTYGLNFGVSASGIVSKVAADTWSGVAVATGTAGWFRFYANPTDAGALSTTLPRFDGSIATSGAQLNMSSTSITSGATITIDTFAITFPAA